MAEITGVPKEANTNLDAASQDGTKVKDDAVGHFSSLDYQNDAQQSFRLTHELQKVREELKSGVKPADFEDLLQCLANKDFWALARSYLPILRGDSNIDDLESTPEATACVASIKEAAKGFIPEFRRRQEARWRAMVVYVEELNRSSAAREEDRRLRRIAQDMKRQSAVDAVSDVGSRA
ncbi:hypothetical protein LTR97_006246 [Elasticomyces elasticus]|uniref:Uncharacterized protein n=1 Tax=Elasticomyces elasticus TaxID=574655 RepID=A0AAN7W812_9PEZI|nr:hypothetical protein LTR97_006246 [Elasticomyces elasticus]